jgi:hypothetical protein
LERPAQTPLGFLDVSRTGGETKMAMRAAALFLMFLSACSAHDDLALLELDRLEPSEVEPGETLRVHGRGFALGRVPEIVIRGTVHRPGIAPSFVEARLSGTVRSESLIEIPITDDLVEVLGGRATLDGLVRVGFRAADDRREVFSETRARIDFLPDTSTLLRFDRAQEPNTEPAEAQGFGVELSREELGTVGVRVVSVEVDGLAAQQGVKAGDSMIGLDGVSLYSWRDFIPDPSTPESLVYVTREGLRGAHALRWPHEVTDRPLDVSSIVFFLVVGLLIGWLSPAGVSVRASARAVSRSTWVTRAVFVLVLAAALVCAPALHWATLWIFALGTFAALSTLVSKHSFEAFSFALVVAGTLTIMLLAKTASVSSIVAAQSPSVLRWYLAQTPASSLAFVAYLHALSVVSTRPGLATSFYLAIAAVFGATLFAGGWPVDGALEGTAVLVGKGVAVLVAARLLDMTTKTASVCAASGLGLALASLVVESGGLFPHWSALALGAGCAVLARAVVPPLRREASPALI